MEYCSSFYLLFTVRAAIFDCQLGGGEDSPAFWVGNQTLGDIPVEKSDSEVGNSGLWAQMERTIRVSNWP